MDSRQQSGFGRQASSIRQANDSKSCDYRPSKFLISVAQGEQLVLLSALRRNARFEQWKSDIHSESDLVLALKRLDRRAFLMPTDATLSRQGNTSVDASSVEAERIFIDSKSASSSFQSSGIDASSLNPSTYLDSREIVHAFSSSIINVDALVEPFCDVVTSGLVPGEIALRALQAIKRILESAVHVCRSHVAFIGQALNRACATVCNVKFEAIDAVEDETVVLHTCYLFRTLVGVWKLLIDTKCNCATVQTQNAYPKDAFVNTPDARWILLASQSMLRVCLDQQISQLLRSSAQDEMYAAVRDIAYCVSLIKRKDSKESFASDKGTQVPKRGSSYEDEDMNTHLNVVCSCYRTSARWCMGSYHVGHEDELQAMVRGISKTNDLDVSSDRKIFNMLSRACLSDQGVNRNWGKNLRIGTNIGMVGSEVYTGPLSPEIGNAGLSAHSVKDLENDMEALDLTPSHSLRSDFTFDDREEVEKQLSKAREKVQADGTRASPEHNQTTSAAHSSAADASGVDIKASGSTHRDSTIVPADSKTMKSKPKRKSASSVFACVLNVIVRLASSFIDPASSISFNGRCFGADLLGAALETAIVQRGHARCITEDIASFRFVILRHASRSVLRALGYFTSAAERDWKGLGRSGSGAKKPGDLLAALFQDSFYLLQALNRWGSAFMLALFKDIFPTFYVARCEKVVASLRKVAQPATASSTSSSETKNLSSEFREIGLHAIRAMLLHPGLLELAFCSFDCGERSAFDCIQETLKGLTRTAMIDSAKLIKVQQLQTLPGSSSRSFIVCEYGDDIAPGKVSKPGLVLILEQISGGEGITGKPEGSERNLTTTKGVYLETVYPDVEERSGSAQLCASIVMEIVASLENNLLMGEEYETRCVMCGTKFSNISRSNSESPQSSDSFSSQCHFSCPSFLSVDTFQGALEKKRLWKVLAAEFNRSKGKKGAKGVLDLLNSLDSGKKLIHSSLGSDQSVVADFLLSTPNLSKQAIGVILGEDDAMSKSVLLEYTQSFDFYNVPFTAALRVYLESFRLPGEAQKIDRIMHAFANHYFGQNKKATESLAKQSNEPTKHVASALASADAAYVLAFAVVMLNTDQHNHSVKRRMTLQDFVRNNRGINDGKDVPLEFLKEVFDSIRSAEIKLSDESGIENLTDVGWDHILRQTQLLFAAQKVKGFKGNMDKSAVDMNAMGLEPSLLTLGSRDDARGQPTVKGAVGLIQGRRNREIDSMIFESVWVPVLRAATISLYESNHSECAEIALSAFDSIGRCAAAYRCTAASDMLIASLVHATRILQGSLLQSLVAFGTSIKAQMIASSLFHMLRLSVDWIREAGWSHFVSILLRWLTLDVLPQALVKRLGCSQMDFLALEDESVDIMKSDNLSPEYAKAARCLLESPNIPRWWPSKRASQAEKSKLEESERALAANKESSVDTSKAKPAASQRLFSFLRGGTAASTAAADPESAAERNERKSLDTPPAFLQDEREQVKTAREHAKRCIELCKVEDVLISESKLLRPESLQCLAASLAHAAWRMLDMLASHSIPTSQKGHRSYASVVQESRMMVNYERLLDIQSSNPDVLYVGEQGDRPTASSKTDDSTAKGGSDAASLTLPLNVGGSSSPISEEDDKKARELVAAFCIDVLTELAIQNRDRLFLLWPHLYETVLRVIAEPRSSEPSMVSVALVERCVVCLLRVGTRLLHRQEVREDVLHGLQLLLKLRKENLYSMRVIVSAGILQIVSAQAPSVQSSSHWTTLISMLLKCKAFEDDISADFACQTLEFLVGNDSAWRFMNTENYRLIVLCASKLSQSSSPKHSVASLDILLVLCSRIPVLVDILGEHNQAVGSSPMLSKSDSGIVPGEKPSYGDQYDDTGRGTSTELSPSPASSVIHHEQLAVSWTMLWEPLLSAFVIVAHDKRGGIRNYALLLMERVMTSGSEIDVLGASELAQAIDSLLLPLLHDVFAIHDRAFLMKKEVVSNRELEEVEKTQLRVVILLSKVFLQHHARMAAALDQTEFVGLWCRVIGAFKNVVDLYREGKLGSQSSSHSDGSDMSFSQDTVLLEHISETVTNMVLVLAASGLLKQSQDDAMWRETVKMTQDWLPGLNDMIKVTQGAN